MFESLRGLSMRLEELYTTPKELEKYLWEMANLSSKVTGIDQVIIWASSAQDGAKRHGPRVKISARPTSKIDSNDLFVLTIQDNPQVVAGESYLSTDTLEDVKTWVSLNKGVLLSYWKNEITTDEFLEQLVKL